jgi:hypothetical protein
LFAFARLDCFAGRGLAGLLLLLLHLRSRLWLLLLLGCWLACCFGCWGVGSVVLLCVVVLGFLLFFTALGIST